MHTRRRCLASILLRRGPVYWVGTVVGLGAPWWVAGLLLIVKLMSPFHPDDVQRYGLVLPQVVRASYWVALVIGPVGLALVFISGWMTRPRPVGGLLALAGLASLALSSPWWHLLAFLALQEPAGAP